MSFKSRVQKLKATWQLLYQDLINIVAIKKSDSKKYSKITTELGVLIWEIDRLISDYRSELSKKDIENLEKIKKDSEHYLKVAQAA
jgi:hypothetical protein